MTEHNLNLKKFNQHGNSNIIKPKNKFVGFIGSQNPKQLDKSITKELVIRAIQKHWIIISNLQPGINETAHITALMQRQKTLAVNTGIINQPYPKQCSYLYSLTLINHGCVIANNEVNHKINPLKQNQLFIKMANQIIMIEPPQSMTIKQLLELCQKSNTKLIALKQPQSIINNYLKQNHIKII